MGWRLPPLSGNGINLSVELAFIHLDSATLLDFLWRNTARLINASQVFLAALNRTRDFLPAEYAGLNVHAAAAHIGLSTDTTYHITGTHILDQAASLASAPKTVQLHIMPPAPQEPARPSASKLWTVWLSPNSMENSPEKSALGILICTR